MQPYHLQSILILRPCPFKLPLRYFWIYFMLIIKKIWIWEHSWNDMNPEQWILLNYLQNKMVKNDKKNKREYERKSRGGEGMSGRDQEGKPAAQRSSVKPPPARTAAAFPAVAPPSNFTGQSWMWFSSLKGSTVLKRVLSLGLNIFFKYCFFCFSLFFL